MYVYTCRYIYTHICLIDVCTYIQYTVYIYMYIYVCVCVCPTAGFLDAARIQAHAQRQGLHICFMDEGDCLPFLEELLRMPKCRHSENVQASPQTSPRYRSVKGSMVLCSVPDEMNVQGTASTPATPPVSSETRRFCRSLPRLSTRRIPILSPNVCNYDLLGDVWSRRVGRFRAEASASAIRRLL